jgi:hypothetical protein
LVIAAEQLLKVLVGLALGAGVSAAVRPALLLADVAE